MITILLIVIIYLLLRQSKTVVIEHKSEQEFWDGPKPTKLEKERNIEKVFSIIEQFPDGHLARQNPEYVEEYLKRIDLDLPDGVEKSKE